MRKLACAAAGLAVAATLAAPATAGAPKPFKAKLTGGAEVPRVDTDATGRATVRILANGKIRYRLRATGLSGPPQAAHIHQGEPGEAGGIIVDLKTSAFTLPARGTVSATRAARRAIRRGDAYVNIHTADNPAGEIRGQLGRAR
jgi:hypothetical protein